ncbi:MAG: hypothetical protein LBU11_12015, partial [Zoogloeaceae bacterium]|nr:hypothetical protein [Zoogloeaceae bacterium]
MNRSAINAPLYNQRRIGTLDALRMALGLSLISELLPLAKRADGLYRVAKSVTKRDGSIRNTYDAPESLKNVHRRIKKQILDHVNYPAYLMGSIKGCDYKGNAKLHARAKIVINEDISEFFPATSAALVAPGARSRLCPAARCISPYAPAYGAWASDRAGDSGHCERAARQPDLVARLPELGACAIKAYRAGRAGRERNALLHQFGPTRPDGSRVWCRSRCLRKLRPGVYSCALKFDRDDKPTLIDTWFCSPLHVEAITFDEQES